MRELFEHTADLGLRARADDLNMLFAEMAACLFDTIVETGTTIEASEVATVEIESDDVAYLLFDWLRELLYRFDAEGMLYCQFDVTVSDNGLSATIHGEAFDADKHKLSHEVKAITYHELKVVQEGTGWLAEVIVDI